MVRQVPEDHSSSWLEDGVECRGPTPETSEDVRDSGVSNGGPR